MANGVFNISRGSIGYYADDARGLVGATDRLHIVVLQAAEVDDTLNNYDTLAAVLAGSNTEAASTNYARILLDSTDITWTVDDTGNDAQAIVDADQTWTSVSQAASEAWVKLLMCYGTSGATDANIRPLTYHDFSVTPNGGDITANFDQVNGFYGST
jgi:hypothetical protein